MLKFLIVAALALPSAALAHAHLVSSVPAIDSAVPAVQGRLPSEPPVLQLIFSEDVEPRFTKVTVKNEAGTNMVSGPVQTDPADGRLLLVPVPTLAPGTYTVDWHAVSIDTHKSEGTYHFSIQP